MTSLPPLPLPSSWGIRPVLFTVGSFRVESYPVFMALALFVGILVFVFFLKKEKKTHEHSFYILIAALVGGVLGAKIPIWLTQYAQIATGGFDIDALLSGRTIVGGLIGGTLAVWWIKRRLHIKQRIGNAIAPALAAGIAVGRWGCFLRGCCHGQPTLLPWGVDFGDGILRHPTQLYESLFGVIAFLILIFCLRKKQPDGLLLTGFMIAYFLFRFFLEFIRTEPRLLFGFTGYQYAAIVVLVYYALKLLFPFPIRIWIKRPS
ncbi:MAG: prolipoprotein diacylglyceryl transferase [Candidatus Peribacteraceae bacterium]|nr:prolipoprotein diacylglyceryl transferase [Candidatus Peribacteraceae bacterium]